jgi:hypothetical protein
MHRRTLHSHWLKPLFASSAALMLSGGYCAVAFAGGQAHRTVSSHSSARAASTLPTLLTQDYTTAFRVRPAGIGFGISDNIVVTGRVSSSQFKARHDGHIQWTSWTGAQATGVGTQWQNDCSPSCPTGTYRPKSVTIRVYDPIHGRFSALSVTTTAGSRRHTTTNRLTTTHANNGTVFYWGPSTPTRSLDSRLALSRTSPAFISTAACGNCRPFALAQHPKRLMTGPDGLVINVRWAGWGAGTAIGRGTLVTNTGLRVPGTTLVVSHLVSCDGRSVYSKLDFRASSGRVLPSTLEFDINGCVLRAPGFTAAGTGPR